jgi:hypothetical protein
MSRLGRAVPTSALVLGVVLGLIVASVPLILSEQPLSRPSNITPGPGQYPQAAYRQVESILTDLPGGPWGLISMEAIVASTPAAPFLAGEDRCQILPGPNLWNLSRVPSTTTSLWGGKSLFWQLVFMNGSSGMVLSSSINGSIVVDGPYNSTNPCVSYLETGAGGLFTSSQPPSYWAPGGAYNKGLIQSLARLNSSAWAPTAASNLGNNSAVAWDGRMVTYYTLGYTWLNLVDWTSGGWLVWYWACGLLGRSGEQPFAETSWGLNSTPSEYYGSETGATSCPVNSNAHFAASYSQTSATQLGAGWQVSEQLKMGVGNGTYVYYDTANSLVAWMSTVSLESKNGTPIDPTTQMCSMNTTNLAGCAAPAQSWYAVLLSPDDYVLDSYPAIDGGTQWAVPNVFVTNNDTLVLVSARTLAGSGDLLSIGGAYPFPEVLGNATL